MTSLTRDYEADKQRLKEFLTNFDETDEEGNRTFKYADKLTAIAHREQTSITISLEDVAKMDEDMATVIRENTRRYIFRCVSISCTFRVSVCLSVRLSVCPSVRLSVCPSVRLSVCLSYNDHLPIHTTLWHPPATAQIELVMALALFAHIAIMAPA